MTDEGAGKQHLTENHPSSVIASAMPPSPQGVKAFAPGQAAKVDSIVRRSYKGIPARFSDFMLVRQFAGNFQ